jgi:hypothetical protein
VAAGPGAAYGAPVPFPVYHHPAAAAAYYAHASMAAVNAEHPLSFILITLSTPVGCRLRCCCILISCMKLFAAFQGVPYMAGEAASAAAKGKRKARRVPSGEGASSSAR